MKIKESKNVQKWKYENIHLETYKREKCERVHVFFIKNSIFGVNVKLFQQIYVFKVKSCLGVA